MNIRLYLGAVTFPLQVKHVLSPTAKLISDYLIESEIDLTGEILCLDAMDQVYDLLFLCTTVFAFGPGYWIGRLKKSKSRKNLSS